MRLRLAAVAMLAVAAFAAPTAAHADLCVYRSDGSQILCLPIHWPPV